jgi:hypothetical protein
VRFQTEHFVDVNDVEKTSNIPIKNQNSKQRK